MALVSQFWTRLTTGQRYYLLGGSILLVSIIVVQFILIPYVDVKTNIKRAIATNERILKEVNLLGSEYRMQKSQGEKIQKVIAGRPPGFTLFTYLERKTGEAGIASNLKYMNPSKSSQVGPYEENAVEMKLDKVTLKQLTNLLYLIESPQDLIRVSKISVTKMREAPEYLSVLLQVVTYQSLKTEKRRG